MFAAAAWALLAGGCGGFLELGGGYPVQIAGGSAGHTYVGAFEVGMVGGGAIGIGSDDKRLSLGGGFRVYSFDSVVGDSSISCMVMTFPLVAQWRFARTNFFAFHAELEAGPAFRRFKDTNGNDLTGYLALGGGVRFYPGKVDRSLFYFGLKVRAGYLGEGVDSHVGGNIMLPVQLDLGFDFDR